jgi:hypothetical protein
MGTYCDLASILLAINLSPLAICLQAATPIGGRSERNSPVGAYAPSMTRNLQHGRLRGEQRNIYTQFSHQELSLNPEMVFSYAYGARNGY